MCDALTEEERIVRSIAAQAFNDAGR